MRQVKMGPKKPDGEGWDPGVFEVRIELELSVLKDPKRPTGLAAGEINVYLHYLYDLAVKNGYPADMKGVELVFDARLERRKES